MNKGRLEAFSDGVIAILITIMVLELHVPEEPTVDALVALWPIFLSYVLSFVLLGTYWNNHHHYLQASVVVDGRVLWANLHLLFWLSLVPFATGWMGETTFAPIPTAAYGIVMLMAAFAFYFLIRALIEAKGQAPTLAAVMGRDRKGKISPVIFAITIPIALVAPAVAMVMFIGVTAMWIIPDLRIERALAK